MKGILIALTGSWLSGLAIPGIKFFLSSVSPFNLIFISNIGAIVVIVIAKYLFSPGIKRPHPKEWIWLGGALFIGSGVAVPLAVMGMVTVSGSVSGLLFNLEIFFTFYLAQFLFRERLSRLAHGAMLLVFAGGLVSGLGSPLDGNYKGVLMIMASCLLFAFQTNMLKKIETQDSFSLATVEFATTGLAAFLLGRVFYSPYPEGNQLWGIVILGVCTYAFGNVLFYRSLKKIGAGRTATIFGSSPLFGALSAFVILGDPLTLFVGIGLVLVILGIGLLTWEGLRKKGP